MENMNLRDFEISFAIEKDLQVEQFAFGNELVELLNKELRLQNYSTSVKCLFVVFQCFDPKNEYINAKESLTYKRKNSTLELFLIIDYTQVKMADMKKMKQILVESYISGVEKLLKHKEFNEGLFYRDISKLFHAFLKSE
jgi:hypothetical protein